MSEKNLIMRARAVAHELYERRIQRSHPLRGHEDALQSLAVEAYTAGFLAGLEQASSALRVELEATRGEAQS